MRKLVGLLAAVVALLMMSATSSFGVATSHAKGTFKAGSGLYLTSKKHTDGLSKVDGKVTFSQPRSGGTITVTGHLAGLKKNALYVAVLYKDGECLPVAGITAFPSGSFRTDAKGKVTIPAGVTVNPAALNPLGVVNVPDTHSISIRRVILTPVPLPAVPGYPKGVPAGTPIAPAQTPTVPNVAYVEGCVRAPVVTK